MRRGIEKATGRRAGRSPERGDERARGRVPDSVPGIRNGRAFGEELHRSEDLRPLTPLLSRGAPFDAVLDADLDSDARKGDLNVRRLDVVVDDMSLVGHGRLESLTGQPRFEDFTVEMVG